VDSHLGVWTNQQDTYAIPVGTRSITYSMEFVREVGSDLDAFVDDNSLTISNNAVSATPEPSTLGTALLGVGAVIAGLRRRSRP
jgi:MYXO-CTERM domain-containing protein